MIGGPGLLSSGGSPAPSVLKEPLAGLTLTANYEQTVTGYSIGEHVLGARPDVMYITSASIHWPESCHVTPTSVQERLGNVVFLSSQEEEWA